MELESYQIPKSYQSYLETFQDDPVSSIERLKSRVEKRNAGAVGYFFLAWLYLKNGDKENALEASMNAKVMAPGSQLMSRLHYFIAHPRSFEAWQPEKKRRIFKRETPSFDQSHPIQDLDSLISKLSSVEKKRIKLDPDADEDERDLSASSMEVDDIVTETLAVIHEKQKNYPAAIETYQRLKSINPSKSDYFEEQIRRLKKMTDDKDGGD